MVNVRRITMTLSAALAGLAVAFLAPPAHGHGNNPPSTGTTKGDDGNGGDPPEGPSFGPGNEIAPQPDSVAPAVSAGLLSVDQGTPNDALSVSGTGSGGDVVPFLGPDLLGDVDLFARVAAEPTAAGMPDTALPRSEGLPFESDLGLPRQPVPSGGVGNAIPAPGTVALLGLALFATKRRRRRG